MHGSIQREHTGCRNLRRHCSRHMRSVLPLVKTNNSLVIEADHNFPTSTATTSSSESFLKDGRKISVGDCALFKPTQDSPPYIGLIRCLRITEENLLQLGVNWLYRPAEIKLGKGTLVEGAPNEIFYSFHEDEIPAESLLHPCKVAFLPKAVDLPAGTSSFVCRRVYDITNKCLWWLTDQDYINGRQEEVDQLLYRTRVEMHSPLQSGGRSPKQINSPTSTSQVKSASDSVQNNIGISSHSQMKGKKRERDHGGEQVKLERCPTIDDNDSFQCKEESDLKAEISRITDRGGLVDLEGVEKLVQLMQLVKTKRKTNLAHRSLLAGAMAATDKADCLNKFVQMKGLRVFDEWLQDVHKGKVGDSNSFKGSDASVDEFLLVLLRALDKLPVDLQALQLCNIGRSVNHLRSHKNPEIQKKARSLVDTWKKRVEAEMITNEAKSGPTQSLSVWPSKSRVTETSHSGGRTPTGSDAAIKSSSTQNAFSKSTSARSSHVDSNAKSATSSPGHSKSASLTLSARESLIRMPVVGTPDAPIVREDRSSSSNQSHSQSQSSLVKEEAKSTVGGTLTANKTAVAGNRNKKACGFPVISGVGVQKELSPGKNSSVSKYTPLEKLNQSTSSSVDKVNDLHNTEASSHKLIVKIPNRVRSPAAGISGASHEELVNTGSRVSSPVLLERPEQCDRTSEGKTDLLPAVASESNVNAWRNNDPKDVRAVSAEASVSPASLPDEEKSMTTDPKKPNQLHLTNPPKSGKVHASSFSPMNALMTCVKYSEANSSLSLDDDVGMNLLATVAAGEISRSDMLSPTESTERSIPVAAVCPGNEEKSNSVSENNIASVETQTNDDVEVGTSNSAVLDVAPSSQGVLLGKDASNNLSGDPKLASEDCLITDCNKNSGLSNKDTGHQVEVKLQTGVKSNENTVRTLSAENLREDESEDSLKEKGTSCDNGSNVISDVKVGGVGVISSTENTNFNHLKAEDSKPIIEVSASHPGCDCNNEKNANEDVMQTENVKPAVGGNGNNVVEPAEKFAVVCAHTPDRLNSGIKVDRASLVEIHEKEVSMESKKILGNAAVSENLCSYPVKHVIVPKSEFKGYDSSAGSQLKEGGKCPAGSTLAETSTSTGPSEMDAKVEFDLNEGFHADEGKNGEPANLASSCSSAVRMMNSLSFSVNPISSSYPTSITVAAAAKGPFVPPDDLLRNKGELGWRGSAATSAFRPAEPRKVMETPLVTSSLSTPDASSSKRCRITLDFDLNVPDERVYDEMASRDGFDMRTGFAIGNSKLLNEPSISGSLRGSGGLDLDLNKMDDACDTGNCSTSSLHKGEISSVHLKHFDGLLADSSRKGLDLNDRPGVGANADQFLIHQPVKVGIPSQLSAAGLRMAGPGQGSFSSWFPPGNSYSTIAIPPMLPDRAEHPFPVFPPSATQRTFCPSGVTSFTPEIYRGSVLSSSPAVPFPSSTFQFPLFPFGETYPLPSASFSVGSTSYMDSSSAPRLFGPPVHSQFLGPVGSFAPQFQRPYMVAVPDNGNNGSYESNRRCGRPGFDLNAGPGVAESEVREEAFPMSAGQNSVPSSSPLAEEQTRMYSASSGMLKRKEPEGGWDSESFRFKQFSWQ